MAAADDRGQRPSLLARLAQDHVRVFFFSLGKLGAHPVGSLLTALVIGITLALPASLHLLTKNLSAISYSWEGALQLSLFLRDDVDTGRGQALARELAERPTIAKANYISRQQSLTEFRELSGFGEALDILQENPLPAVITVLPERALGKVEVDALLEDLGRLPEIELAKLDQKWLERLYAILSIVERTVLIIAGLLAIAVVVVVGNTIRLDIAARREEIVVMKLIGAPDSFIRRPFLYTGLWYGLAGSVLACVLIGLGLLALSGPTRALASTYETGFAITGLSFGAMLTLVAAGILLGWLGAFWTVSQQLSKIEPQ